MSGKFTPGRWLLIPYEGDAWIVESEADVENDRVARVYGAGNARLIADAPEMIGLLRSMVANGSAALAEYPEIVILVARNDPDADKKTAATGASAGGGLAGGQAGSGACAEGSAPSATNVAPAGPARSGERPENRGGAGKAEDMTDAMLAALIRGVWWAVDHSKEGTIAAAVQPLRDAGIVCGPYRGDKARESTRNTMLWYAGEIVDIVDQDKLFAVNSWVNTVDKFVPTGGAL